MSLKDTTNPAQNMHKTEEGEVEGRRGQNQTADETTVLLDEMEAGRHVIKWTKSDLCRRNCSFLRVGQRPRV